MELVEWLRSVFVAAALSACTGGNAECTLDADCDQGMACELSECVAVCVTDAECGDEEACVKGLTTQRRICAPANTTSVRTDFVVIRDRSTDASCQAPAPGTQLAFVLAEDADGELLAWGRVVRDDVATTDNDWADVSRLDGARPTYGADSCAQDEILALGCGGAVALQFFAADGASPDPPLELRSGEHKLRIGASGMQCDGGRDTDRYEVFLCPEVKNVDDVPLLCTLSVGIGHGERAFDF